MEEGEPQAAAVEGAAAPPAAAPAKTASPSNVSLATSPIGPGTPIKSSSPDHLAAATASGAVESLSQKPIVGKNRSRSIKRGPGTGSSAGIAGGSSTSASRSDTGESLHHVAGTSFASSSAASTGAGSSSRGTRALGGRTRREKHQAALESIRKFLRGRSSYDVLPVSFRLVVLDTKLVVKPALDVMWQSGVVSAPLWQSTPADVDAEAEGPGEEKAFHASASAKSGFAGMLTVNDIIHLIQYYYKNSSYDNAAKDVETFRLEKLKDIEKSLHVPQPPTLSVHPLRSLFEACQLIIRTHARRLPLIDHDEQTGIETVLSVLTQYRVLKFIAMNCRETSLLHRSIRSLGIGTYIGEGIEGIPKPPPTPPEASAAAERQPEEAGPAEGSKEAHDERGLKTPIAEKAPVLPFSGVESLPPPATTLPSGEGSLKDYYASPAMNPHAPLATATLDTTVFDAVHLFSELGISSVPVLDAEGNVVDLYEAVDVVTLVRTGAYQALDLTIRQAIARRPPDFQGVFTCSPDDSLANIFALLRRRRVHRLLILENDTPTEKIPDVPTEEGLPAEDKDGGAAATPGEEVDNSASAVPPPMPPPPTTPRQLEDELEAGVLRKRGKGKLVGILCLSDILRYVIGEEKVIGGIPVAHPHGGVHSQESSGKASSTLSKVEEGKEMGDDSLQESESKEQEPAQEPVQEQEKKEEESVEEPEKQVDEPTAEDAEKEEGEPEVTPAEAEEAAPQAEAEGEGDAAPGDATITTHEAAAAAEAEPTASAPEEGKEEDAAAPSEPVEQAAAAE